MSHILEFLDLVDVPNTYSGADNYRLKVDVTKVGFVDDTVLNLNDTPSTFSGYPSAYVKVNSGSSALEFVVDDTFHSGTANEITAVTPKTTLVDADEFILEDSGASFVKKAVTAANLAVYVDKSLGGPWLPISAGSGQALTGDLYIETDSSPKLTITYTTSIGSISLNAGTLTLDTNAGVGGVGKLQVHGAAGLTYTDNTPTDYTVWTEKDFDYADYLPLAGGSITGTLKVDDIEEYTTSHGIDFGHDIRVIDGDNPRILLAEGGSATTYLQMSEDGDSVFTMRRVTDGSASTINISADPSATGTGTINLFNGVTTTGSLDFQIYAGAVVTHKFEADTGSVYFNTGNLFIDKPSTPSIRLREDADTLDYSVFSEGGTILTLMKVSETGQAMLRFDPRPDDNTSSSLVQFFRTTTTSGTRTLTLYEGDGTDTAQHVLNAGTGDVDLCIESGQLTLGGTAGAELLTLVAGNIRLDNNYGLQIEDFVGTAYEVVSVSASDIATFGNASLDLSQIIPPIRVDADSQTGIRRYVNVYSHYLGGVDQTGAIVFKPFGAAAAPANTMFHFLVYGYTWESAGTKESDGAWCVSVGGYCQTTPTWSGLGNTADIVYGNPPIDLVRLGRDASGYHCVILGETDSNWDYPQIAIDAISGYSGADDWNPADVTVAIDSSMTSFTFDQSMPLYTSERMYVKNTTGSLIGAGAILYISGASSERPLVTLTDADAASTSTGMLVRALVAIANNGVGEVLVRGWYSTGSLTPGAIYYLSNTPGLMTATAPSGTGDIVRVVGYAMTATQFWFDPSKEWTVV